MRVYRVAHERTTDRGFLAGPYASTSVFPDQVRADLARMAWAHGDGTTHRSPKEDPRLERTDFHENCGLISREALFAWFDGYADMLHRHGFRIHTYYVPMKRVRIGLFSGQVVFDRYAAISLSVEPMTDKEVARV